MGEYSAPFGLHRADDSGHCSVFQDVERLGCLMLVLGLTRLGMPNSRWHPMGHMAKWIFDMFLEEQGGVARRTSGTMPRIHPVCWFSLL